MRKKKRLLIVTPTMGMGGAERLVLNLINYLNSKKFEIILCMIFKETNHFYRIPKKVKNIIFLEDVDLPQGIIEKIISHTNNDLVWLEIVSKKLLFIIENYKIDICFSNMVYSSILCLYDKNIAKQTKLITSFDVDTKQIYDIDPQGKLFNHILSDKLPNSNLSITIGEEQKKYITKSYNLNQEKVIAIPYPIDIKNIRKYATKKIHHEWFEEKEKNKILLTACRLENQKRVDLLIKAFSKLLSKGNNIKLIIVGDSSKKKDLEKLVLDLDIENHVWFTGKEINPYKYMSKSSVFVLSSDYEGWGQTICEALACGCPVVATDCDYGPNEILKGGEYGILVKPNSISSIVEGIEEVLGDQALREYFSVMGKRRVKDFDIKEIVKRYEEIFEEI